VADNSHQISGVAERYASSLYELAADAKSVDAVAKDLDRFQAMIDSNSDLQRLVSSPVFSAEDQSRSIVALIEKAKISGLVGNFLKVVARNRRLFAVPVVKIGSRQVDTSLRTKLSTLKHTLKEVG
jgi:F-type H+-transporting ATPase subunit delta